MAEPFLGQIQPFGFSFAPKGWALCNGQILPISQNTALFSLLGTFYGGNGQTSFGLPNLQSRVPMHLSNSNEFALGEQGGEESVTILLNELPPHSHSFSGTTSSANDKRPLTGAAYAATTTAAQVSPGDAFYAPGTSSNTVAINPGTVQPTGAGQPHSNLQPYLTISWCIALQGVFPSRN